MKKQFFCRDPDQREILKKDTIIRMSLSYFLQIIPHNYDTSNLEDQGGTVVRRVVKQSKGQNSKLNKRNITIFCEA